MENGDEMSTEYRKVLIRRLVESPVGGFRC